MSEDLTKFGSPGLEAATLINSLLVEHLITLMRRSLHASLSVPQSVPLCSLATHRLCCPCVAQPCPSKLILHYSTADTNVMTNDLARLGLASLG